LFLAVFCSKLKRAAVFASDDMRIGFVDVSDFSSCCKGEGHEAYPCSDWDDVVSND